MAMQCHAVTYKWPYVTNVEVVITGSTTATYNVEMSTVLITDDDIKDNWSLEDVMVEKGTGGGSYNYIWGPYHRHKNNDGSIVAIVTSQETYSHKQTWMDVTEDLARKHGSNWLVIHHSGVENGGECIGSGIRNWETSASIPWGTVQSIVWNGGVTGGCLGTPPVNQWCAMKTPTVEIAYGTMTLKDAEGSDKTAGVTVECTAGMKYTLRLRDANNETPLDNGGRVTWQAGGKAMGETLTGEAGENGVDLTATLHGPFERTGEFHGSGILFVSYP